MATEEEAICDAIELSLLPGIGNLTLQRLWQKVDRVSDLFTMDERALASMGFPAEALVPMRARVYREAAAEIYDWGKREGCHFLVRGGPSYPSLLEEISDPPLILYARGRLECLQNPCVAVVGTRRPTVYGLQMAQGLSSDLGSRGFCIASGLARGIDAAAHRGCLEGKGVTLAVLGSGIDIIYPKEHRRLSERIAESGLLISEFPPGTAPVPQNFPIRNRIISGVALGTIIIEAGEYSGSLITARMAMEHNREVFAIPGNITTPQSFGPNFLIKQGAKLVQSWRDVVEEMPPELRREILVREDARPCRTPELDALSEEEKGVIDLLRIDAAVHFDRICQMSRLGVSDLSHLLLDLEMRGWIRQLPGNLYIKTRK